MTTTIPIHGTVEERFDSVRDAFARNFDEHGDVGAGVAVYLHGEPVLELWGGYADEARTQPWQRDTIANVYFGRRGVFQLRREQPVHTLAKRRRRSGHVTVPIENHRF